MTWFTNVLQWFAGGQDHPYMRLYGCMRHDNLWVGITVGLDAVVAAGYALIALHWWRNARGLPDIPAKRALWNLRNIFILCGICGYIFTPVKMVWPAWRLYDLVMVVLAFYTWRYAWGARDLKVIYRELGRTSELEADLNLSRAAAERNGFFLNAISHDLRTPLNSVVLQSNLAEMAVSAQDEEMLRSSLADLRQSAAVATTLLDHLLEYAKLGVGGEELKVAEFPLCELLSEVASMSHAAAAARGLSMGVTCPAELVVRTDRVKLGRILTNLLGNAVKFTEKGSVRVTAEQARGGGVEVHVVDTGPGIQPDHQARLFDEFFQVQNHERNRSKGFGLGLSIARRLARQLGGDVAVDSSPGRGSRFSVLLPDAVPRGTQAAAVRAEQVAAAV